jgi:hypothetical protein
LCAIRPSRLDDDSLATVFALRRNERRAFERALDDTPDAVFGMRELVHQCWQ